MPERRGPTIDDVAARAGVSPSTVSRVLNGKTDVSAATRSRVESVMKELAFSPALMAQGLARGRARTLSLLFPGRSATVASSGLEMVFAVARAAARHGYACSLVVDPIDEGSLLDLFRSGAADGVVLALVEWEDARVDVLREHDLPFVGIGRTASPEATSYVDVDEEGAVEQLVDYLVTLGHRRIAFMARARSAVGLSVRLRRGFERAVERHGLDAARIAESELDPAAAGRAALDLLRQDPGLTAFVTTHWGVSAGLLGALAGARHRVPEDLSVVGLAPGPLADATVPALTGVAYPAEELGQRAVDSLVSELRQRAAGRRPAPEQALLQPGITIRRSVGPPRQRSIGT